VVLRRVPGNSSQNTSQTHGQALLLDRASREAALDWLERWLDGAAASVVA